MKIAIIGLGYVGSAVHAFFEGRCDLITYDPKYDEQYPESSINNCDIAIVCVPTPMAKDKSCDTSIVEEAVSRIDGPLILIKSTIAPGTTDKLIEKYKKNICFSPEYIGESTYNNPVHKTVVETPFLIVGGKPELSRRVFEAFEPIMGPYAHYFSCSAIEAEVIKYMENSYLATKVAFVNEFYDIAKVFGADWHTVREGWLLDERIGRAFSAVFKNNRGFSGKCLPKDVNAIISASKAAGYTPRVISEVSAYNDTLQER